MNKSRYGALAWFTVFYCVLVILWGAFVRATGSGAGCGDHWPLCNGAVVPQAEHIKTLIEYSHRLSSGLCLVFVFLLFFFTFRLFPKGSFSRKAATYSLVAVVLEALIGAALVLLRLVEHDQSMDRVISISLHLVNTLFLLASLTLTAMAPKEQRPAFLWPEFWRPTLFLLLGFGFLGALGAMTALGDTLFPVSNLMQEMRDKFAGRRHFLQQIRLLHPLLAVVWAGFLWIWLAKLWELFPSLKIRAQLLAWLTAGNLAFGLLNVAFLAPIWMQLVHLLWAQVLWILLVSLVFSAASRWPRGGFSGIAVGP